MRLTVLWKFLELLSNFTFDVLAKPHGGRDGLALFLHHLIIIIARSLFPTPLTFLVARRKFFGKGKHGEDYQKHCHSAQEETAPP